MPIDDKKQEYSYDNGFRPKKWDIPEGYKYYNSSWFINLIRRIVIFIVGIFFYFYILIKYHVKTVGKKNRKLAKKANKKEGAVFICNHVYPNDATLVILHMYPRILFIPSIKTNMGFGLFSRIMRAGGIVPIPTTLEQLKDFDRQTIKALKDKKTILFMAEAELILWSGHIREFERGAIKYAYKADQKIYPICYTYHSKKRKGKHPFLKINFLEPYTIQKTDNQRLDIINITNELQQIMNDYFVTNSDPRWLDSIGLERRNELLSH